jgi:hypothetical protein
MLKTVAVQGPDVRPTPYVRTYVHMYVCMKFYIDILNVSNLSFPIVK